MLEPQILQLLKCTKGINVCTLPEQKTSTPLKTKEEQTNLTQFRPSSAKLKTNAHGKCHFIEDNHCPNEKYTKTHPHILQKRVVNQRHTCTLLSQTTKVKG